MTDQISEDVIIRIRKLLDLAQSSNPNEAAMAAQKAAALLRDYQISEEEVRLRANKPARQIAEDERELRNQTKRRGKRTEFNEDGKSEYVTTLADAVASANFCRPLYAHSAVFFYGEAKTVKVVGFMFESLYNRLWALAIEASKEERQKLKALGQRARWFSYKKYRYNFLLGAATAIRTRLLKDLGEFQAANPETALALTLDPEINAFIEEKYPKLKNIRSRNINVDYRAYKAGHIAGQKIDFQQGIAAAQPTTSAIAALPAPK